MKEYSIDKQGYYNTQEFKSTGRKFRPIDVIAGRLQILSPQIVTRRFDRQDWNRKNSHDERRDKDPFYTRPNWRTLK